MNKLVKVLAASALVATVLVGCGKKDETGGGDTAAKYAKVGLGVVSSFSDEGQVNSTMAAIGLDKDGKIQYIDIDVAQSTPGGDEKTQLDQTKKERKSAYGMKNASKANGKIAEGAEWDEQAAAFEKWAKGKTPAEVAAVETEDFHGGKAAKTGTDLAAGCTITIDDFLAAVDKAAKNAVEANAEKIAIGDVMENDAEKKQLNTTIALVATDADNKIVYSKIDVAQIYKGVTDTKSELKEKYGMKKTSADAGKIKDGGEWYEQAAAFEEAIKGKPVADVANIETEDYHGGKAPKTGTDLASKCTITIDAFLKAIAEAGENLK
ncbi:hypothetical protein [Candidatus Stoquefichus massiliensis]|uniref:hypothetical protein n=1 Tax=Candidatus Stoquefichus massiliensis TaxID=1470350 RepID=UPI00048332CF|nr:hypothetical protein [Candidatus Stoquefichus massiliensis]